MIYVTSVLFITFVVFVYLYLTRNFNYWQRKGVPSIPKPYPLLGNLLQVFTYRKIAGEYFKDMYLWNKDAPYVGFYIIDKPALLLRDPDVIKQCFVKHFSKFSDRNAAINAEKDPVATASLFFMKNPMWKHSRAKLTPLFSVSKLKAMLPIISDCGHDLTTYIYEQNKNVLETHELCNKFMVDAVMSFFFGIKAESFGPNHAAVFRDICYEIMEPHWLIALRQSVCFLMPELAKFLRLGFFDKQLVDKLSVHILKIFEKRKCNDIFRNDLINVFIQFEEEVFDKNGLKFDKNWLMGTSAMMLFAGVETGSGIISYTLYELSLNQCIQRKLRSEIKEKVSVGQETCLDVVENLKYLNMVISETCRKYPVTHFLERMCVEDCQFDDSDVVVEKGTPVFIPIFGLHYDPKYFQNPKIYDPERFNDENRENISTYAYLPFGAGPRDCIGKRLGYVLIGYGLIKILSEYEVFPIRKDFKFDPKSFIIKPIGGLPLMYKKINKSID